MDPKLLQAALEAIEKGDNAGALEILKQVIAAAAAPGGDVDSVTPTPPADASQESADMTAALAALSTLTGRKSAGEAVHVITERFAQLDRITANQTALDDSSRKELVGELVKLGAEIPATAWEDPDKGIVCVRLRNESVDSLRDRVGKLKAANGGRIEGHTPPATSDDGLTVEEEKLAAKMTPEARERFVALRLSRRDRRAS